MQVISKIIKIQSDTFIQAEDIELEFTKRNIRALRWAIVNVSDKIYTVSVANLKE